MPAFEFCIPLTIRPWSRISAGVNDFVVEPEPCQQTPAGRPRVGRLSCSSGRRSLMLPASSDVTPAATAISARMIDEDGTDGADGVADGVPVTTCSTH